jgi:hypothetical protein
MDDPALRRFIERGDERALILRFAARRAALGQRPEMAHCATVALSAAGNLASAFRGRFGIGHGIEILWAVRLVDRPAVVKALELMPASEAE